MLSKDFHIVFTFVIDVYIPIRKHMTLATGGLYEREVFYRMLSVSSQSKETIKIERRQGTYFLLSQLCVFIPPMFAHG